MSAATTTTEGDSCIGLAEAGKRSGVSTLDDSPADRRGQLQEYRSGPNPRAAGEGRRCGCAAQTCRSTS